MTIQGEEPGLRERKRLETRRAIQHAVLSLTVERGFDRVTIDDVSRAAGVSPRTFFNYFDSKDAALVGDIPEVPAGDPVEFFVHAGPGGDILAHIGDLFIGAGHPEAEDHEIHQLRKAVLRDNPHLLGLRMASMRTFESALYDIVVRRVAEDDPSLAGDENALFERAWMITLTSLAALRHAWRCWADADHPGALDERMRVSFRQLHDILLQTR